jgi:hypothetical protein
LLLAAIELCAAAELRSMRMHSACVNSLDALHNCSKDYVQRDLDISHMAGRRMDSAAIAIISLAVRICLDNRRTNELDNGSLAAVGLALTI